MMSQESLYQFSRIRAAELQREAQRQRLLRDARPQVKGRFDWLWNGVADSRPSVQPRHPAEQQLLHLQMVDMQARNAKWVACQLVNRPSQARSDKSQGFCAYPCC